MLIDIVYEGLLRERTGKWGEKLELHNSVTVKELLNKLSGKYGNDFQRLFFDPDSGEYREGILILINERKGELDSQISDDAEVVFIPAMAGGTYSQV